MAKDDDNKIHEYVMHNMGPIVRKALSLAEHKELFKPHHDQAAAMDAAMVGAMRAVAKYNPKIGNFPGFAMQYVYGAIKTALREQDAHHVIPYDRKKAAALGTTEAGEAHNASPTQPAVADQAALQGAGGSVDESGATTGASTDATPAAKFARQNPVFVNSVLKPKVEATEAANKPVQPAAPIDTAIPAAPKTDNKTIIRRKANPDQLDSMTRIDSIKAGKKE